MTTNYLTSQQFYEIFDLWANIWIADNQDELQRRSSTAEERKKFQTSWNFLQQHGWREVINSSTPQAPDVYCPKFHEWAKVKIDAPDFWNHWCRIELAIMKSCLLDRLIYGGEKLRTQKCPKHLGKWSGCSFASCECSHDSCLTGWIKNPDDPTSPNSGITLVTWEG